ncbi:hypothetical protein [Streptomyces umbrinus]|uniref:hypothetical protein n=1 Tax=Streptomyces umbrinus TaxID=67370 RepID=UPI0033E54D18
MPEPELVNEVHQKAAQEHAQVVRSIMDNVYGVLAELDVLAVAAGSKPPMTTIGVLDAASRVTKIDPAVRNRLEAVAKELPDIRAAFEKVPEDRQNYLRAVASQIRGSRSMAELNFNLGVVLKQAEGDHDTDLLDCVHFSVAMLEAGQASIYDPKLPFYRVASGGSFALAKDATVRVAATDASTAVGTAFTGVGVLVAAQAGLAASGVMATYEFITEVGGENDVELLEDVIKWFPV